ncbi:MAG: SGNH/GDSL hydrolase family protein [Planctomycetota bacterium]
MSESQSSESQLAESRSAETPPPGWFVRSLRSVFSTLLALAIALILVEVAVRLLGLGPPERGPNNRLPLKVGVPASTAPLLQTALRPGAAGEVLYPSHGDQPDRVVEYRINADGFRDREESYAIPKPEGVFRIACLGDSVTYGTGVALEDTLPKQLERALADVGNECRVEVLNCGIYAHNTSQEVAWFEFNVRRFEPDLVLVVANLNDASGRNLPAMERETDAAMQWIHRLGLTSGVWDEGERPDDERVARTMALRRASHLADLVAHHLYLRLRSRTERGSFMLDWRPGSPGEQLVDRSLARLAAYAAEDGFTVEVGLYPNLEQLDDYPYAAITDVLRDVCDRNEIGFRDLLEPLVGLDAYALRAHPHDHHPNARAHGLVAEWWSERLSPSIDCGETR